MSKITLPQVLVGIYIGIVGWQFVKNHTISQSILSMLNLRQPVAAHALFSGKDSLGSIAVGTAEGNITPRGEKTSNYYIHIDPGNQAKNRGFCSWNKAARLTVSEADKRCLAALRRQAASTEKKMNSLGVKSHTVLLVNGTDLWNQSDTAGPQFAKAYKKAQEKGMIGDRALLWARVEAFRDSKGVLDASGLFKICRTQPYYIQQLAQYPVGSEAWRWQCIALDQQRRVEAINRVIDPPWYTLWGWW